MRLLHHTPIKRKLTIITMLTSGVALLLVCIALFAYEQITFHQATVRDFSILADMFEGNVSAGLVFKDADAMEQTLKTLRANPHILAAAVYDHDGEVVANYQRSNLPATFPFPAVQPPGSRFQKDRLDTFQKINLAGEEIGTVYIASDLNEFGTRLKRYALIMTLVLLASSAVAFGLSAKLRKMISEPVSHLAKIVHIVAAEKNYSVRAVKWSEDELGELIDGFNEMLSQIQQRDAALHAAQNELEARVRERTKELASSLSLLNATLEATTDGVVSLNLQGQITSWNNRFVEIWGFPAELLEHKDTEKMLWFAAEQGIEPELYIKRFKLLVSNPRVETFDVVELKDGRIFERYSRPQSVGGECTGTVLSYRDITARTQAEQQVAELNRQLVDISRRAGMSEVASSVLHNVGNVLNSVNISLGVAAGKAASLKTVSLSRLAALLRDHADDLPKFFASHPQGPQLPAFLAQLAEHFATEQRTMVAELESLHVNFEHINEIVAMQQSYAGTGGMIETLSLASVIDDALRMNAAALQRHGVRVARELDATLPMVEADRHKILLILANLIRNAKYACDDAAHPDKCITVRACIDGGGMAKISVSDNGIGIPPENFTRIFEHGFTTRKTGHGFGLHSSALAARDMGGSLHVQSDGPGHGATFTIELPVHPAAASA